jgi:hypothetical protein
MMLVLIYLLYVSSPLLFLLVAVRDGSSEEECKTTETYRPTMYLLRCEKTVGATPHNPV